MKNEGQNILKGQLTIDLTSTIWQRGIRSPSQFRDVWSARGGPSHCRLSRLVCSMLKVKLLILNLILTFFHVLQEIKFRSLRLDGHIARLEEDGFHNSKAKHSKNL